MSVDELRILFSVFVVAAALILIILERVIPYTKNQSFFREGFFNDFFLYTLLQSFFLGIIISYIIEIIDNTTGLSRLQLLTHWPVWVQVAFFVVTHDFYIYWFHRYQHNSKIFWRMHEAHHSTKDVDWLSGSRSHVLEILINQTIEFAPIVLLGSPPEVAIYKGAISAVWGMYIHANINVNSGWLQYFINGPEMHRWHHADNHPEAYNKNFSTKLAVWDWLFGTAYFPGREKPKFFGISNINFPKNYIRQQLIAFRKFND